MSREFHSDKIRILKYEKMNMVVIFQYFPKTKQLGLIDEAEKIKHLIRMANPARWFIQNSCIFILQQNFYRVFRRWFQHVRIFFPGFTAVVYAVF